MATGARPAPIARWTGGPSLLTLVVAAILLAVLALSVRYPIILVNSLVTGGMWALMAAGLALVFGVMNIANFAHGEFFMVGTLVAYLVFTPIRDALGTAAAPVVVALAPFIGIAAAVVVGGLLGVVLELLLFRPLRRRTREGWVMNTFLLTAGVSTILINGTQILFGTEFRGITHYWDVPPVDLAGVNVSVDRLVAFGLALATILLFWVFLRRTDLGRAVRAVSQG